MNEDFLQKLWECAGLEEALAVIAKQPHSFTPLDNKRNNKAPVRANRDPINAIIELCTNGHDGNIRLWREKGQFAREPTSVTDALSQQIMGTTRPNPHVHVHVQLRKGSKFHKKTAVTVIDEGVGMTADGLRNGPLRFGSEDKVLDLTQFGSFGQGGASIFGHCRFSLLISRHHANPNKVVFTCVWLHRPKGEIHSYVYLHQKDGALFECDANRLNAASLGTDLFKNLENNRLILPKHGTIRRQLQMDGVNDYFTQRADSLYYGLQDRLFGCPAYVRMAGDDDDGHLNNRRGRRFELDAVPVGQNIPRTTWKMMGRLDPINIMIHRRDEKVGMVQARVYAIASYRTKPTEKTPKGELKTPARHMLEGNDRVTARSIFVTLNGQTLTRLQSTRTFCNANLRELCENLIVEVSLDLMPEHVLQDAELFNSARDGIVEWFQKALLDELRRMLADQPELLRLAKEMMPPEEPMIIDRATCVDVNKMLADPLLGDILGFRTIKGKSTSIVPGTEETEKRKTKPPQAIELHKVPTFLEIRKLTVIPNATNWLTLHTDAYDSFGSKLELVLPLFLTQMGPGQLQNGRMTVGVDCSNVPLGEIGVITARLRGTKVSDEREITVVSRKEAPKKTKMVTGDVDMQIQTTKQGPPSVKMIEVSGDSDPTWSRHFAGAVGDEAIINYHYKPDVNELVVALNVEYPKLLNTRRSLEKQYGPAISRDFFHRLCQNAQIKAIVFASNTADPRLGPGGAVEAADMRLLTDMTIGDIVNLYGLYQSAVIRQGVMSGAIDD